MRCPRFPTSDFGAAQCISNRKAKLVLTYSRQTPRCLTILVGHHNAIHEKNQRVQLEFILAGDAAQVRSSDDYACPLRSITPNMRIPSADTVYSSCTTPIWRKPSATVSFSTTAICGMGLWAAVAAG